MPDKNLQCRDCGAEFVFTEGEQNFYREKGFENDPVRCPDCRRARKNARRQQTNQNSRY
ncbi:MAG: zinc-ribbon domain-containing protein [Bacillota bacterium]|nr:zinc-ribbon domain-containing protein [Bacillota bacterium]